MDDLISRQAAIKAVLGSNFSACTVYGRSEEGMATAKELIQAIKNLPSAHPLDPCKTCLHKGKGWDEEPCDGCTQNDSKYEPDNGWIPVSERLPEEGQSCLVTQAVVNGMRIIIIATFTSDLYKFDIYDFAGREGEHGWVRYDDEYGRYYDVDVLAWMPLPDPYKEVE